MIPPRERLVLEMLRERPRYGRELVADSRGELASNAIYVLLSRLQKKGLAVAAQNTRPAPLGESGPGRRVWSLTTQGVDALAELEQTIRLDLATCRAILEVDDTIEVPIKAYGAWGVLVAKATAILGRKAA